MALYDASPRELASLFPRLCPGAEIREGRDSALVKKLEEEWGAMPWEIAYAMVLLADNGYPRSMPGLYSAYGDFVDAVTDQFACTVEVVHQLFPDKPIPQIYRNYRDYFRGVTTATQNQSLGEIREKLREWCESNQQLIAGPTKRRGRPPTVSTRG